MYLVFLIELIYKKIYLSKNSYLSKSCNDFFQINNASISNYLFSNIDLYQVLFMVCTNHYNLILWGKG